MGEMNLVGDVDENGGAARGDAAAGDEEKKTGEELLHLDGGGEIGRHAKEFDGEILRVIMGVLSGESSGGAQGEVAKA